MKALRCSKYTPRDREMVFKKSIVLAMKNKFLA